MEKLEETTASTAWYDEELAMGDEERWKERDKVGRGDCGEEGHAEGLWLQCLWRFTGARLAHDDLSNISTSQSLVFLELNLSW